MRVTNKMLSNTFLSDMRTNLQNLKRIDEQLTSGKEIRKPSDNPFKVARSMQLHTDINTNKQYNSNIKDTINWLNTTDTALGQANDVFHRIRELLVASGNGAYSENERLAIKDEINEKVGEFAQILNTNFDGKYVFAGTRATTKPMEVTGGTSFKGAAETKKIDLTKLCPSGKLAADLELKIEIKDGTSSKTITLDKIAANTKIQGLSGICQVINDKITVNKDLSGKLRAVPNIKDETIKFVNIGGDEKIKYDITGLNMNKSTSKYEPSLSNTNTRLVYYKKGGGELTDGNELNQIGQKLKVQISDGVITSYSVSAKDVIEFNNEKGEEKDLRQMLQNIVNHLDGKNDDGTAVEPEAIKKLLNEDLQNITDAMNNLLKIRSAVGAKQNAMDSAKFRNIDQNFNMTEILSKTEDIDFTEKNMEYATMATVYMASLQVSARILQPSLVDFIR